jgi:peptidase E
MNLLLTSAGFKNQQIAETFLKTVGKPADQIQLIFIPTASRTPEELHYIEVSKQELDDLGIKNIHILNLDHKISPEEISGADVIYVCGGNTFYLLQKIRESEFDKALSDFGGLYVGVSAGSIVTGPDIASAGPWDENDVNLSDTSGLKLVNFVVAPHFVKEDKKTLEVFRGSADYEIINLTDNQAILVKNGKKEIIEKL